MKTLPLISMLLVPFAAYSQRQIDTAVHLDSLTKVEYKRNLREFALPPKGGKVTAKQLSHFLGISSDSDSARRVRMPIIDPLTGRKGSLQEAISRLVISEVDVVTGTSSVDTIHWLRPLPASEIMKMPPR